MAMIVDICQMVDLAISTPEAGVVNFNVLNTLLHIIVNQVKLNECRIELEDQPCGQIDNLLPLVNQKVHISEYTVTADPDDAQFMNRTPKETPKEVEIKSIIVVRKKSSTITEHQIDKPLKAASEIIDFNEDENISEGYIESESTHSQSSINVANVDSFVSERLDAAENSIQQINSKVNDISKDYNRVSNSIEAALDERMSIMKDQLDEIEQKIYSASVSQLISVPVRRMTESVISPNRLPAPCKCNLSELEKVKGDLDYIKMAVQRIAMCSGMKDIANYLNKDILSFPDVSDPEMNDENNEETIRQLERKVDVLDRFSATSEKRIFGLEHDFSDIKDRIEDILQSTEAKSGETNDFPAVYETISDVCKKAVLALEHCSALFVSRDTIINELQELAGKNEQIDESKIDRVECEELLTEKADYNMVLRKVDADHFDAVTGRLKMGISEALEKINDQEIMLVKVLLEMDSKIDNKLEKSDLSVVTDEINVKISSIQGRLRTLAVAEKDSEAAGIRSKYLRDVACLSCQKPVIMKTQESNGFVPKSGGMISSKSNKPQLTYNLDAVRRQMGKMPAERDMHHFEKMMVGTSKQTKNNTGRACLRFCGGSHTLISAEDKFHKTHFERPESSSLRMAMQVDNYFKGKDGAMYKVQLGDKCECVRTPQRTVAPNLVENNAEKPMDSEVNSPVDVPETQTAAALEPTTEAPASQTQIPISDLSEPEPVTLEPTSGDPAIVDLETVPIEQESVTIEPTSGDPAIGESQTQMIAPTEVEEPLVDTNSLARQSLVLDNSADLPSATEPEIE